MAENLLEIQNLKVYFNTFRGYHGLHKIVKPLKAVDDISFSVRRGETLGLVGESGCGKSTTGKAIVRLLTPNSGQIRFDGMLLADMNKEQLQDYSRRVQIIFQDPYSSLDPRFTVARTIAEPMVIHRIGNRKTREERVRKLMEEVGLLADHYHRYPHEFSGGQRQRVGIARALSLNSELIVCDEPVSALDVSIQAQILNLMQELQRKYHLTYILISHNLSVVKHVCDRIAVMYLGKIVEIADKDELFFHPRHPYTRSLLSAVPEPDPRTPMLVEELPGDVPSPIDVPDGCSFHTRCPQATELCKHTMPSMIRLSANHSVCCHLAPSDAPNHLHTTHIQEGQT